MQSIMQNVMHIYIYICQCKLSFWYIIQQHFKLVDVFEPYSCLEQLISTDNRVSNISTTAAR